MVGSSTGGRRRPLSPSASSRRRVVVVGGRLVVGFAFVSRASGSSLALRSLGASDSASSSTARRRPARPRPARRRPARPRRAVVDAAVVDRPRLGVGDVRLDCASSVSESGSSVVVSVTLGGLLIAHVDRTIRTRLEHVVDAADERGVDDDGDDHDDRVALAPRGASARPPCASRRAPRGGTGGARCVRGLRVALGAACRSLPSSSRAPILLSCASARGSGRRVTSLFVLSRWGSSRSGDGQGRRDSNPRPSVLETDALPAELLPSVGTRQGTSASRGAIRSPRQTGLFSGSPCGACADARGRSTSSSRGARGR